MTFVETSLANGDLDNLINIRYKNGQVNFLNRNHFVETDWLKNNANLLENVSHQYGKTSFRTVIIDKKNWFKKVHNTETGIGSRKYIIQKLAFCPKK